MLWVRDIFLYWYLHPCLLVFSFEVVVFAVTVISSLWSGMTSAMSSVAIFRSRLETDRLEPKASQEAAWCSGERTKPAVWRLNFLLSSGINWLGNLEHNSFWVEYLYLSNGGNNICSTCFPDYTDQNKIMNMKAFTNDQPCPCINFHCFKCDGTWNGPAG